MNRNEFDHVIRAAAAVVEEEDIVVIGSQSILGSAPNAPQELLRSIEADVYPMRSPERAIEIDGALGDGSIFHETFGYYAHGVGPETADAPSGLEGAARSRRSRGAGRRNKASSSPLPRSA